MNQSRLRRSGAALIIVLAFTVILSGLVVAYLARTSTDRQLAQGTFNNVKADELARSALDLLIGDLKQEITDGSTVSTISGYSIYTPSNPNNILPIRSGNPSGNPGPIPNMIRRSVRIDPIIAPGIPSRASAVNSESDVSLNRRLISSGRWNKHYLVPRLNAGSNTVETTPVSSFASPDWVIVTAHGPMAFDTWNASLGDLTKPEHAIGRYAYVIYDESGLIDANVAGFPSNTTTLQSGRGGSLAFANLTPSTGINLPQSQIDGLVGWRNYASAQPTGSFPSFVFDSASATRYFNYVLNNTGFLTIPGTLWNAKTDQALTSRQQFLALRSSLGFSQDALQYLTTFSRATNAPSASNFLSVRASSAFTRSDGTAAVVGEPLVKARFPLSRLAWITFKGPSAEVYAANSGDPVIVSLLNAGVSVATLQKGTAVNIQNSFGLFYSDSPGNLWIYSHGAPDRILSLSEVASNNREPDFLELLQASILPGSLGQASGGLTGSNVFPDIHMANATHHLLSIGAAIIDQSDPDSIPTRLRFTPVTTPWVAYGVEDLPYINQIFPIAGVSPDDPLPSAPTKWALYILPQLWNPMKQSATAPTRPNIRLRVDGDIGVIGGLPVPSYPPGGTPKFSGTGQVIAVNQDAFISPTPLLNDGSASYGAINNCSPTTTFPRLPTAPTTPDLRNYVGLRMPDYQMSAAASAPSLYVVYGADVSHRFNLTMEIETTAGVFVPYNRFVGIDDVSSWITSAETFVRKSSSSSGNPSLSNDQFTATRLTNNTSPPANFMKADPRSTRFGALQIDNNPTTKGRIDQPLWPSGSSTVASGYGGTILDPGGPVEHAPQKFAGNPYLPGTLAINAASSTATRTSYADNDGVIRPADAVYPDPSVTTTGASTPYYTTSTDYHPLVINRPFRNVGELGYAFRDLPWKSLDFFSEKSADAGLLDVFSSNDEPAVVAGRVSLNSRQVPVVQSLLAGAILDEQNPSDSVSATGTTGTAAPVMAGNLVAATIANPLANRAELLTRSGLPLTILPLPSSGIHDQTVKSRREVVSRALSTVAQTRTWNLLIDVVAQSGRYPSMSTDLPQFAVEGEKRYWLHVAIDRFTGKVIDQQLEAVLE